MIAGIQKLTLLDYPNQLACILFLPGCNMRCPYCHNLELVLHPKTLIPRIEVMNFLKSRQNKLTGVVISGGEPTLCLHLISLCQDIKQLGYKIKLDTNGTNLSLIQQLIENKLIDYLALDIKNVPNKTQLTTGSKMNPHYLAKVLPYLLQAPLEVEFRTTIVKEFHNLNDIETIAKAIKGAKQYTLQSYRYNQQVISPTQCSSPDADFMQQAKRICEQYVSNVTIK